MAWTKSASLLSVLLFIAFGLQMVGVISVPITRKITLCTYNGYEYGVWGYCQTDTDTCTSIGVGYPELPDQDSFRLPGSAQKSLSNILIVHVVAAGCTFLLFLLSLLAHCLGAKFLLALLILAFPVFLVSLLVFLVEVLLFVNHLSWAGWFTLGSVVLTAMAFCLLCVMRRNISANAAMGKNPDLTDFGDVQETSHMALLGDRDDDKLIKPQNMFEVSRVDTRSSSGSHNGSTHNAPQTRQFVQTLPQRDYGPGQGQANRWNSGPNGYSSSGSTGPDGTGPNGPGHGHAPQLLNGPARQGYVPGGAGLVAGGVADGIAGGVAAAGVRTQQRVPRSQRGNNDHQLPPVPGQNRPEQGGQTAIPAGTYLSGVEDQAYGPNVVPIPRIRQDPSQNAPRSREAPHAQAQVKHSQPVRTTSQRAIVDYLTEDEQRERSQATGPTAHVPNYSRMTMQPQGGRGPAGSAAAAGPAGRPNGNGARAMAPPPLMVGNDRSSTSVYDPAAQYREVLPDIESQPSTPGLPPPNNQTPLERFMAEPPQQGHGVYEEPPVNQYAFRQPDSPAGSDMSGYTSISQRFQGGGAPGPRGPAPQYGGMPRHVQPFAPQPSRSDFAIQHNPDFSIGGATTRLPKNRRRPNGGAGRY